MVAGETIKLPPKMKWLSRENEMLQGLRTVIYGVSDIARAKAWYSQALGSAPYFDEPFYVGFNVDGYEMGLNPNAQPISAESAGVVAYWGVEDIEAEFKRLLSLGFGLRQCLTYSTRSTKK